MSTYASLYAQVERIVECYSDSFGEASPLSDGEKVDAAAEMIEDLRGLLTEESPGALTAPRVGAGRVRAAKDGA